MGIDLDSRKYVLEFYAEEIEGPKFWLKVLTDLKIQE